MIKNVRECWNKDRPNIESLWSYALTFYDGGFCVQPTVMSRQDMIACAKKYNCLPLAVFQKERVQNIYLLVAYLIYSKIPGKWVGTFTLKWQNNRNIIFDLWNKAIPRFESMEEGTTEAGPQYIKQTSYSLTAAYSRLREEQRPTTEQYESNDSLESSWELIGKCKNQRTRAIEFQLRVFLCCAATLERKSRI